jgi:lactate dehydrogenase-like 2-hydroxyacid dehydrogenase
VTEASTKPAILLGARMPEGFLEGLATRYTVLGPLAPPFAETVAALPVSDAQRVRALILTGSTSASRASLACLPALGLVCCIGSGYEGVDLAAARERGIAVTNSPGTNAAAVADLAMGLLIASVRQLFNASATLRRGEWTGNSTMCVPFVRGLTGRKVGIYGLGAIGERIARRAAAFEMEVGYHNRNRRADVSYPYFATLRDLAHWADVLVVAVRADASNRHAVDTGVLAALGADGHIVNIARGWVIDETALIRALRERIIAGAGLDVFEREPSVPAELLAMPNVALTPHIGGGTVEALAGMQDVLLANLDAFFQGRPVLTPVPKLSALASTA